MIKLLDILTEALNQQQIVDMAKEFMNSESYNSNHDCKRSTFEFIKWAKKNKGFEPDALLLAPPKDIKKFPGKSGTGDSHIFAIIDGFGVDFTANQFPGISEPLKITPESQIPSEYKKIGGYYTNFPDWFENSKTSIKSKFNNLPQWFHDGFEKEGFKPELNEMIKLLDILKEIAENKIAILIDGTSSAGKSMAAQILKAVPYYKAKDPNQWVQIDSDMFGKNDKQGKENRIKYDHAGDGPDPKAGEEFHKLMAQKRKGRFGENRGDTTVGFRLHPHNKDLISGVDSRNWYMAQEYKYGGWKKVIFDDIDDGILKYIPNVKHVLLHAPLPILLSNIAGRPKEDARAIDMVLDQYLEKYEATTSKPSEDVGDPNTVLTKSGLEKLLSQHTTDQKYIDDFIKKLGITGDSNYYIKAKNINPNKTVLINVDQESRDAKIAPAKLQQMFNKI